MEHAEVVLHLPLPKDQHATEPVHPAVCTLHDPAASIRAHLPLQRLRLHAPRSDESGEPELTHQLPGVVVVPLSRHITCGRCPVGSGRSTGMLLSVASATSL